jgi:hypothetical protein
MMFLDLKSFIVPCDYCVCAKSAEESWLQASVVARQIPGVPQQFGLPVWTSLCTVKLHTGPNNMKDSVCTSQKTRYFLLNDKHQPMHFTLNNILV